MKKWIIAEDIIKLMKKGWELGHRSGIKEVGSFYQQKIGLCRGGDTIDVHSKTLHKLLKQNLIEYEPKRQGDGFWLTRYRIKNV